MSPEAVFGCVKRVLTYWWSKWFYSREGVSASVCVCVVGVRLPRSVFSGRMHRLPTGGRVGGEC